jgi:1-acyl-sn-glycerol-3-phosphate acyltransferase
MQREKMRNILCWLMDHITRAEYLGMENIPPSGPVIIATNHLSRLDIPLLLCNPVRKDLTGLVATKYLNFPVLNWIINSIGPIWIDREIADFGAIRVASEALQKGVSLGISPEGTRASKTHGLLQAKAGVVLLALKSGAPIVPVGVYGTESGVKKLFTFRKPHMIARFGKAFTIPAINALHRAEELLRWTDEVMCRIGAMLPESYRGFYRDHPRLKELLALP